MAMNVGGGSGTEDDPDVLMDINTTPLIDVMLVLLIMLIITIPIQTHSIKLDLPVGTPPPVDVPPPVVNIDIDFDGLVYWDGQPLAGPVDLDNHLRAVAAQNPQPEVHVKPNKLVTYKYFAAVMAAGQRDGVTKIGVLGNEQFVD
jgi:biopolymer transport protein ExbD